MERADDEAPNVTRAQRSGPGPPPPGALTPQTGEVSQAMDRFQESIMLYCCAERKMKVSVCRVLQAMYYRSYSEGLDPEQIILSGSKWEGMPWDVCGDRNKLITQRSHPTVVFHPPSPGHSPQDQDRAGHVIAWPNPAQPAYLNLVVHCMPLLTQEVANSIIEYNGTQYLANSSIVRPAVNPGQVVHGPATTEAAYAEHPEMGMSDSVPCFYSPAWPTCAKEFFTRPRSHGWPPHTLLSLIQREGCHVVGASHQATARRDLEWRWSMSLAEKELIHYLPTEMVCTLYVIKAIKNHTWKEDTDRPQPICSYFIKVACLWVAELTGPNDAIMDTVRNVLDWLIQCYLENNIPDYFIPNQNLIGHLPPDTCQEMAGKLREVKSELLIHVLCGMGIDREVEAKIKSMQGKLSITPIDQSMPEGRYRQLLSGLLGCDSEKAVSVLEEATYTLGPGSEVYARRERFWESTISAANYISIRETMAHHISTSKFSDVIAIPEIILLYIIENLPSLLIEQSHVDTYRASMYRLLGEIYQSLYIYYTEHDSDLPPGIQSDCKRRAERYYTDGLQIPYPDGWTDRGLTGYVHLAKFHYLNGEWRQVEGVMGKLQPLLEELRSSPQSVNGLSVVHIDTRYDLCKLPWRVDQLLYCPLVEEWTNAYVRVNPVVLGYYIQGRLAMERKRLGQAEDCVRGMQKVVEVIWDVFQVKSTRVFIAVLEDYLKVSDIV